MTQILIIAALVMIVIVMTRWIHKKEPQNQQIL